MASTTPSITSVINELKEQNANLPTEKKASIVVVQQPQEERDTTNSEMLRVLNSIFTLISEQFRFQKQEAVKSSLEKSETATDFQKEPMTVQKPAELAYESATSDTARQAAAQQSAAPTEGGGGSGIMGAIKGGLGAVGGAIGGVARAAGGFAMNHPIATAVGAVGAGAIGAGIYASKSGLLETITRGESGKGRAGYDVSYGHFKSPKNLTDMTIDEVRQWQKQLVSKSRARGMTPSSAVGKYQFIQDTLAEELARTGIKGSEKFTPEIQDKLFMSRLYGTRQLGSFEKGKISATQMQLNLAKELASLPDPRTGKSYYNTKGQEYFTHGGKPQPVAFNSQQMKEALARHLEDIKNPNKNRSSLIPSSNQEHSPNSKKDINQQQTVSKIRMADTSDLRVKGGLKGQAFQGGQTEEGILNLARYLQANEQNIPGGLRRFSSFNDAYHRKANPRSKHTEGLAMDFSLNDAKQSSQAADYVKKQLLAAGMSEEDFKIINEYKNPSKHATGGHIHVNFANKKAAEKFAQFSKGEGFQEETKLAKKEEGKSGRHEIVDTGDKYQKSSAIFAGMLSSELGVPLKKMLDALEKITTNTGDTKEELKKGKKEEKVSKEEKGKEKEPEEKASKAEPEEKEETASKAEPEEETPTASKEESNSPLGLLGAMSGEDIAGADLGPFNAFKKMAAGQKPSDEEIQELKAIKDKTFGQMGGLLGIPEGSNQQTATKAPRSQEGKLSPEFRKEMEEKFKDLSPEDRELAIQEFENTLNKSLEPGVDRVTSESPGLFKFDVSNPEKQLSNLKSDQLSGMGVTGFGGGGMFGGGQTPGMGMGSIFGPMGNNPFTNMQGVLNRVGTVASMGQNIGNSMKYGRGLYGVQGAMSGIGGMIGAMGGSSPMLGGISSVLGNVGGMMSSMEMMKHMGGQGGFSGVMGGINAASGVLGSMGNVFGNMGGMGQAGQGIMGGLSGAASMGGGIQNAIGSLGSGGIQGGMNAASGILGIGGSLFDAAKGVGGSIADGIGGLFGDGDSAKSNGGGGIASMAIGDDAASLKMGSNLGSLQSSNDNLSSLGVTGFGGGMTQSGGGGGSQGRRATGGGGGAGSATGASGGAGFKSGSQRAGTSAGAMNAGISIRNEESTLKILQLGAFIRSTV